jgi:hypothetical protein
MLRVLGIRGSPGWGEGGQSPALLRVGPRLMVSVWPASSVDLFPATWTRGRAREVSLRREASCPHIPTMLCRPNGQPASSWGVFGGGGGAGEGADVLPLSAQAHSQRGRLGNKS